MFKRKIEERLLENYRNPDANILIVKGARQIGKSYIVRYTASNYFPNFVEVDLKSDYEGKRLFETVKTTKDFYITLSSIAGEKMNGFSDTMIFLDEIQYYPHLITMLKDLKKERRYRFIASGSLLGITLKHIFIPMGSIEEVKMFPLDFEEFLWANGVGKDAIDYLRDAFNNLNDINEAIHAKFLEYFKDYLICGGLPDAVNEYVINKNVARMRIIQSIIYDYYSDDCAKYDNDHKLKISRLYGMLISNMANKVKRVQFKKIEDNSNRASAYEEEFDYLISSGVSLSARAISNPVFPLAQSMAKNLIKLYYNDVGLLTNLLFKNNIRAIKDNDKGINLGSVYETAAAMELIAHGYDLYYFDSKKVGEVDFIINDYNDLSPLAIEIKSGNDQNNFRAIPKLVDKNGNYKLNKGYVFGNKNIVKKENDLITLPIYLIMFI